MKKNDDIELGLDDEDDTENLVLPPAKMAINVKSTDPLQLTMSKACLESLSNLSKVCHLYKRGPTWPSGLRRRSLP